MPGRPLKRSDGDIELVLLTSRIVPTSWQLCGPEQLLHLLVALRLKRSHLCRMFSTVPRDQRY